MVLGCALSACGGGGGSGSPAPAAQVIPKPVLIDAQGDSTMWGATSVDGTLVQASPTPPELLQAGLQHALGARYDVTVINHGMPRSQACQRMNGTVVYTTTLADDLKSSPAQYVLENFGINDADSLVADESLTQFQQCLEAFVDTVRAAGKTPILEEPNPVADNVPYATILPTYVAVVDAVAQEKGVLLIQQFQAIQALPAWQSMLSDGVHPTPGLYEIRVQREVAAIGPLIVAAR